MIQSAPMRVPYSKRDLVRVGQCACADGAQMTVPHIRNHAQGPDLLDRLPCAIGVVRRTIINSDDGKLVTLLYSLDLLQQPGTVLFADLNVAAFRLIPTAIERFERYGIHILMYGGQKLKTPIENQLGFGVLILDGAYQTQQALPAVLQLSVVKIQQLVGIERIKKETGI